MTQRRQEPSTSLETAVARYSASLSGSPAAEFLVNRGLARAMELKQFGLGFVDDPIPEHRGYKGWLAIPYLRQGPTGGWNVATVRFRCVRQGCDHKANGHGKYLGVTGAKSHLYNTVELQKGYPAIAICEGELDAVAATLAGVPAVGVAGVENWKDHFDPLFLGYKKVYVLADNDDDGQGKSFGKKVSSRLENAVVIDMPRGHDVNSLLLAEGQERLRELIH